MRNEIDDGMMHSGQIPEDGEKPSDLMQLLDCPFCGSEAYIFEFDSTWCVACKSPDDIHEDCYLASIDPGDLPHYFTKQDGIEAWNTRAI